MNTRLLLGVPMAAMVACGGADTQGPQEPAISNALFDLKPAHGINITVGDSLRLELTVHDHDGNAVVLQRPLPMATTIFGQMTLIRGKPVSAIPDFRLRQLAVHELGHVLGLVGVVQGEQPAWFELQTGRYTGAMALEAWRRRFGVTPEALYSRSGAHWDPMRGVADVMISSGLSGEISTVTVGALMDLGYPIRWSGAGPY